MCRKLEETDIERSRAADALRQSYLKLETVRQEKKVLVERFLNLTSFISFDDEF